VSITVIIPIIMKKLFRSLILIASVVSVFYACNPNDTPEPTGDPRDKFVGSWSCVENSHLNGNSTFSVTVSLNPNNSSQILLANFYQIGTSQKVYGIVANNNVTVPSQTINSLSVRGSGNITANNTKINWNYYVDDGADIDTCSAVYSKQ
jgi:hypothetical protein